MNTQHDTDEPVRDAEGQARRPASRPLSVVTLVVVGVLVGLLAGYFVTNRPDGPVAGPVAPQGRTAGERVAALEQRLADDAGDADGWLELAGLLVTQAAITGEPSFHARADEALDRAEATGADPIDTTIVRATLDLSLHEFARARSAAQDVLDEVPDSPEALSVLVDAEVETGRYEEAEQALQRLLDLRPNLPALARVSYLRELRGDLAGAAVAMQQAATAGSALPDEQANVTVLLGDLQRRLGRLDDARASLARADGLREDLPLAEVLRARLLVAEGDPDRAVQVLRDLTDRLPLPDALSLLHELQVAVGDTEAADDTAAVVRTIAALQRDVGQDVDLEMALFEADAGPPAEAVALATAAHAARPNVLASSALAWALHRAGDTDAALEHARDSVALGTQHVAIGYRAAVVLDAAGQPDEAAEALRLALQDHPSSSPRHADDVRALARELDIALPDTW